MLIGVPKEIKNREFRAGLTPASVRELVMHGHEVVVESQLGSGIRVTDDDYRQAGASVVDTAAAVFAEADLIVKVKEPQLPECAMLREGQLLFTYLHLAAAAEITEALIRSGASAIAYETITGPGGSLPLLAPMSEVAGRLSIQAGAHSLERAQGGSGTLLGGVPGVAPARVLIIGGGIVGDNAAYIAKGMGAEVTILDRSIARLRQLDIDYSGRISCVYSTRETIEQYALAADLVVGAVLLPGAAAPKLLTRDIISRMRPGSVVVDVAIDQGGCFETSRPTTHEDPTYVVDEVVHYCVANMPGAVPRTSTFALNNATLPYVVKLANGGLEGALRADEDLLAGLNVHQGRITCQPVAESLGHEYTPALDAIAS
ncbi:MAG: alanine dehydrogenase [Pseudomonadota bacterium]